MPASLIKPPGEPEPVIRFPVIEEAARDLAERRIMLREDFDRLAAEARATAFTVARVGSLDALEKIRQALVEDVATGGTLRDFAAKVEEALGGSMLSAAHVETVYRTNIGQAAAAGLRQALTSPMVADEFPYVSYEATHDSRTRPEHLELEKLGIGGSSVYRADDPVILRFWAPWDWNCRCIIIPLSIEEAARKGVAEAREWLATGLPPARPAWVKTPDFAPPADAPASALGTVRLSHETGLHWITIGGKEDGGKKHKGGFAVLIDREGQIVKAKGAPRGLVGKKVGEAHAYFAGRRGKKNPEKSEESVSTPVDKPSEESTMVDSGSHAVTPKQEGPKVTQTRESPKLSGSEKQVKWAEDVRGQKLSGVDQLVAQATEVNAKSNHPELTKQFADAAETLRGIPYAMFWINSRDQQPRELLKQAAKAVPEVESLQSRFARLWEGSPSKAEVDAFLQDLNIAVQSDTTAALYHQKVWGNNPFEGRGMTQTITEVKLYQKHGLK